MNRQTLGVDAGGPPGTVGPQHGIPLRPGFRLSKTEGWQAVVRVLRSPLGLGHDLVTTLFPANCRCCAGPLLHAGSVPICRACIARLQAESLTACERCGEAFDLDLDMEDVRFAGMLPEGLLCRACRLAPPEFECVLSFGSYDGDLRTMLQLLKFDGLRGLAKPLGDRLAAVILRLEGRAAGDLLVIAVPLYRVRQHARGYNQAVLLARRAVRAVRRVRPLWSLTEAHHLLVRQRSTEAQFDLSRRGRRRNLRGAFKVVGPVAGREVLLVDDILTSGATARECARVLRAAGATKVWVVAVARAQRAAGKQFRVAPESLVAPWERSGGGSEAWTQVQGQTNQ